MRKLVDDGCNATKRHDTVPEMVFNCQLITPRKREHARFAERSEKSTRLVRSRVAVKTVFSNKSQWMITPDPIITLQPCHPRSRLVPEQPLKSHKVHRPVTAATADLIIIGPSSYSDNATVAHAASPASNNLTSASDTRCSVEPVRGLPSPGFRAHL